MTQTPNQNARDEYEALLKVAQAATRLHQVSLMFDSRADGARILTGMEHGTDVQIVADVAGGYEAWITDPDAPGGTSKVADRLTVDEAAQIITDAYMHDKAAKVLARDYHLPTGAIEQYLEDDDRAEELYRSLDAGSRAVRAKTGAPHAPIIVPFDPSKSRDAQIEAAAWEQGQLERLERLMNDTAGWSVMVLIHPRGDVAFLAPIVPDLRGYEIVAADPNGRYDLWRRGAMVRADLTVSEVSEWLREHTPSDDVLKAELAGWLEEVLDYYKVPKRDEP